MLDSSKEIIGIKDLCELLGISRNTAYDLLRTNKIKAFHIGHTWRITLDSVKDFILDQQTMAGSIVTATEKASPDKK